ncbi:SMI1/KNR4 family protein [Priestia filamentosa]|uniref:SMI1/KNR4 family protein n=1 Tax=Priestia filamentosa TaxID=1402861 RepID=UPI0039819B30
MNEVKWRRLKSSVSDNDILLLEEKMNMTFPKDYKECVKVNQGTRPKPYIFDVEGVEKVFGALLKINSPEDPSDMWNNYLDYKTTLPKEVIPFALDPAGNLIYFDYKNHKEDPIIVFWGHEDAWEKEMLMREEGLSEEEAEEAARENIFHVADTFTDLLQKLHEDEED